MDPNRIRGEMKMCEEDRIAWEAPEWLDISPGWIYQKRSTILEKWENEMGFSLVQLFEVEIPAYTARGTRALLWLGLKAIDRRPPWKDFNPLIMQVETRTIEQTPDREAAEAEGGVDPTLPGEANSSGNSSPSSDASDADESASSTPS